MPPHSRRSPSRPRARWSRNTDRREAFLWQGRHFARSSPLYERLAAELADEPLVASLVGDDVQWRTPLQLFAGLHYLVLSGRASWDDPRAALRDESAFLGAWLDAQHVQTNEVGRCWWLLPCFREVARRTGANAVDCVELGCSGGLNLLWDRYGYRHANGEIAPSCTLQLVGEERAPVPAEVLATEVRVRSRIGVDRDPPDLRTEEAVRLLTAFVWPGEHERLERLEAAVDCWRADPPEIRTGDMLDELPALLARRRDDALLLVWQTAALVYLPEERRDRVRAVLAEAGEEGPLAFVETGPPLDGSHDYYGLHMRIWPGGELVELAHSDFHGAWLEWRA